MHRDQAHFLVEIPLKHVYAAASILIDAVTSCCQCLDHIAADTSAGSQKVDELVAVRDNYKEQRDAVAELYKFWMGTDVSLDTALSNMHGKSYCGEEFFREGSFRYNSEVFGHETLLLKSMCRFVERWRTVSFNGGGHFEQTTGKTYIDAWCSHCRHFARHRILSDGIFGSVFNPTTLVPGSRERYSCSGCGHDTLVCSVKKAAVCGMAKGSTMWDDVSCAACKTGSPWPWTSHLLFTHKLRESFAQDVVAEMGRLDKLLIEGTVEIDTRRQTFINLRKVLDHTAREAERCKVDACTSVQRARENLELYRKIVT